MILESSIGEVLTEFIDGIPCNFSSSGGLSLGFETMDFDEEKNHLIGYFFL